MTINFNKSPYFDDFDANSNFHRILFKPGYAVQTRELTQYQSILQDQIKKFGDHVFDNNTLVSGAGLTSNFSCYFLKIDNVDLNGFEINENDFLNQVITNESETISARVIHTIFDNVPVLFLNYTSSGKFTDDDRIFVRNSNKTARVISLSSVYQPSTGQSSVCSIDNGVFYINGNFVAVQRQTVAVDPYSNTPTAKIGLTVEESITTFEDDSSLLDPAIESTNYQAPGADRYKIFLRLSVKPLDIDGDSTFTELLRLESGIIQKRLKMTDYSEIDKYFARRTFDTNGDYIVNKFTVTLDESPTGNGEFFTAKLSPGIAYVQGFIVENQSDLKFTVDKARANTTNIRQQTLLNQGNYLTINNVRGNINPLNFESVDFHCVKSANLTSFNSYTSTKVGTGKLTNIKFLKSENLQYSNSYVYEAYFTDIQTTPISANAIGANLQNSTTGTSANVGFPNHFSTVDNAYSGVYLRINNGNAAEDVIRISTYNGVRRLATLEKDFIRNPGQTFNFSLLFNTKDIESLYNSNTSGGISSNSYNSLVSIDSKVNQIDSGEVFIKGTDNQGLLYELGNDYVVANSVNNVTYSTWTKFSGITTTSSFNTISNTVFNFNGVDQYLEGNSAASNFIVIVTDNLGYTQFPNNKILPFSSSIANVKITGNSTAQIINNTGSSDLNNVILDVYASIVSVEGSANNFVKRNKTLNSANTTSIATFSTPIYGKSGTYVNLNFGQTLIANTDFNSTKQSLYVSDVKEIVKIIDTKKEALYDGMLSNPSYDVTNLYSFDNGQRDNYYDHASIKLLPNASIPSGSLLVLYNYYSHSGEGYFDNSSYVSGGETYDEIPSYKNSFGKLYQLKDCIDFRPSRINANTEFKLNNTLNGLPVSGSPFICDYSYYLGRKDVIVAGKDKDFAYIEGVSSVNPTLPNIPDESLIVATLTLDPYTQRINSDSRGARYSNIKVDILTHKRWRMQDITELEKRTEKVEYYNNLNSLERSAQELQIPDENNLNRFKSGFVVENFQSEFVADFANSDHYCSIDTIRARLFSTHNVQNFDLTIKDVIKTFGVLDPTTRASLPYNIDYDGEDAFITLPYSKVLAAQQPYASSFINVNPFNVIDVEGSVNLSPKFDAWVSNTRLPDINFTLPSMQSNTLNKLNSANWQVIPGADKNSGNTVIISADQKDFNGFVTDVRIEPYIREQQIQFTVKGLLNNTLVGVYFDDVNVTNRVRETNSLIIDTTNVSAFSEGNLIGYPSVPNGTSISSPIGKIIDYNIISSYTNISGQSRKIIEVDIIQDLDVEKYTTSNISNTIYSLNILQNGTVSSTFKGTATVNSINKVSGRILAQPSANTIVIRRYYTGQANSIYFNDSSNGIIIQKNIQIINEENFKTYSYIPVSATEYANNTIFIKLEEPQVLPEIGFNSLSEANKKKFVYSIKSSGSIKTNKKGTVSGILYLPKDTFKTGDRLFRVDDRIGNNKGTESTFAETKFFASSLHYDKRGITLTTQITPPPPQNYCKEYSVEDNGRNVAYGQYNKGYAVIDRTNKNYNIKIIDNPSAIVTKFELKWKIWGNENLGIRKYFNDFIGTSYPINMEQFITDTISFLPEGEKLNNLLCNWIDVVKVYYVLDSSCGRFKQILKGDPLAQSFIFYKDEYPNGLFLKSIKTFFRKKPENPDAEISCSICDTLNGYPTKVQEPYAKVIITADQVKVSDEPNIHDANTATEFVFPVPVYIKPDTMYAFMLKTNSFEYETWSARLGDIALPSTTKNSINDIEKENYRISQTPYIGELFKSQNMLTWNSDGNDDLMFTIERCNFDIKKSPRVEFVVPEKLPQRKLMDHAIDFAYGSNTNIGAAYTTNSDFVYDAFDVSTTDVSFTQAPIKYSYRATLKSNEQKDDFYTYISPGKYGTANFQENLLDDKRGERVLKANTLPTGAYSFSLYADLSSTDENISPMISETGLSLFGIQWFVNNLGFSNSHIKIANAGTGYSNATSITVVRTSNNISSNVIIGTDAVVEPIISEGKLVDINVLVPGSQYATNPIIVINDPNRVSNVNASIIFAGETSNKGGNGLLRYITKPITLEPNFDAGDLRVYYTAYRPPNTNIYVYYKILNRNDNQAFEDSDWQLMTTISGASTFSNKYGELYEFVASPYVEPNIGIASNKVEYISKENGLVYNTFSQFAIKIVMTSEDPTIMPYIKDMRGVALYPII